MKRLLALFALAVTLGGCSVSINEDSPQVVVVASATVPVSDTPDATFRADASHSFKGTMRVSGQLVRIESGGSCHVIGFDILAGHSKVFNLLADGGPAIYGFISFNSAEAHDDECWLAYTGSVGVVVDTVRFDPGLPDVQPVVITHDQFASGEPVDFTLDTGGMAATP